MRFQSVQAYMREQRIDGWLLHDFRGSNAVLARLLPGKRWTTRRAALFIPAEGEPRVLAHGIDASQFERLSLRRDTYLSWRELHAWLAGVVAGRTRIAMEYAPGATLPAVAMVDAGTVELVRAQGAEVVSSADLIQVSAAVWSAEAVANHERASREVARIKDEAFALIRERVRSGAGVSEREVQLSILSAFERAGLEPQEGPVVAANAHSADPHFEVPAEGSATIKRGDWVLIDLWARVPGEENIFSDITWVAYAGDRVPDRNAYVFRAVRSARDAALERAQSAWRDRRAIQGWELDDAAREQIIAAGHEQHIRHRTGHSLSPGPAVHGLGMNLDNLETHDTRRMLPGTGFTIEPGIYLPPDAGDDSFGVRLEINVYVDPERGPVVTSPVQTEVVLVG